MLGSRTHAKVLHPCQGPAPMLRPPWGAHTGVNKAALPISRHFRPRGREGTGRGEAVERRDTFSPIPVWTSPSPSSQRPPARPAPGREPGIPGAEPGPKRARAQPRRRGGARPLAANGGAPRPARPAASRARPIPLERSRAKPKGAEPDRAEPNEAEGGRTEPSGAEPDRGGPNRTERGPERLEEVGLGPTRLCSDEELERMEGDPPRESVTGVPSPATPEFVPPPPEATGKDIIPVYCSLLAAVVVGLLAYVAFKCWHTCRQKKQLAKARAGDLGTSPEGEKLHSDSGVFLDTHSLQEPHQPAKAPRPEGHPLSSVSPQRQEELERLLESGGPGGDWRGLATRLGFGPDAIVTFGRGRAPARALLSAWAGTEGATMETLCQALVAIGRHDVARRLAGPGDATSAV
ncbi:death domain-containing membrane protein NRADD-like [Numenius arquata]|uniref:death domain-containing membrane protein NRADD-like n=1 Tax=Numenius arquata TaxID=31919 RepID=UPI003D309B24